MSEKIIIALQITVVGMGLVFLAIISLWVMMAVLMRLAIDRETDKSNIKGDQRLIELERKKKAAIAAVVVALAREMNTEPHEFPLPPTAIVSAWQAVNRSEMLKKRGRVR